MVLAEGETLWDLPTLSDDVEAVIVNRRDVHLATADLPPWDRELCHQIMAGLPLNEIANRMQCNVRTVRRNLRRLRPIFVP